MHKERPGVIGWKTSSCQSGGMTREDLHEKDVRAACRDLVSPPSHPPHCKYGRMHQGILVAEHGGQLLIAGCNCDKRVEGFTR